MTEEGTGTRADRRDSGRLVEGPERSLRAARWIATGAGGTVVGLGLCLTPMKDLGGPMALLGIATTIIGLHRFGRSGPDQVTRSAP